MARPVLSRVEGVADALAECLDLVRSGNDIELCLGRYPRYKHELLPLIEVALKIRPLSQTDSFSGPTTGERGRVRRRLEDRPRERMPLVWTGTEPLRRWWQALAPNRQQETESRSHSRPQPRKARTGQASLDEVLAF